VAVEFYDDTKVMGLDYKTYYRNKISKSIIPYDNIRYERYAKDRGGRKYGDIGVDLSEVIADERIVFLNDTIEMAEITTGGVFWDKQGGKIKMILEKTHRIKKN